MVSLTKTPQMDMATLKTQLLQHRLAQYIRLNGGVPVPMAGAVYWLILAWVGAHTDLSGWVQVAFPLSGAIFPLALVLAKVMKCNFMKDKSAIGDVLLPTFISMLLFWAMLAMAIKTSAPELVVPILAIGMSLHWPVIGWSYARTAIFSAHAIIRAIAVTTIWFMAPDHILTAIPLAVAATYILSILAIYIDVAQLKKNQLPPTERMSS